MKVLIGGEFNGVIRDAFLVRGHNAMSCDFKESAVGGPHYTGHWYDLIDDNWDLAIFHPTCTYMANSSSKSLYINGQKENGLDIERWTNMGLAAWGVWELCQRVQHIKRVAIENPVMLRYAQILSELEKWSVQTVQPWWFGFDKDGPDNVKKRTCWWTKGLPKLERFGALDGSTARDECHKCSPTKDPEERRMKRSKFTPGHASAIAEQWGFYE